jgi:hypothetical protein
MTGSASNFVRIKDYLQPPPPRQKSQYELYPLPFFKVAKRRGGGGCTWHVTPTGSYSADYEIGRAYAIEFLKSCDGTVGWSMLLISIVNEMIIAGPRGKQGNGDPTSDGMVKGFMRTIGEALAQSRFATI